MPYNFAAQNTPQIPTSLMHTMDALIPSGEHDILAGGQYVPRMPSIEQFQGVVMPMSDKDFRNAPIGTYSEENQKLYTNGFELRVGAQVRDPYDGKTYMIVQELSHNSIHPMKRYIVVTPGEVSAK